MALVGAPQKFMSNMFDYSSRLATELKNIKDISDKLNAELAHMKIIAKQVKKCKAIHKIEIETEDYIEKSYILSTFDSFIICNTCSENNNDDNYSD